LTAFIALAHSCRYGGPGVHGISPGERDFSVGQPDFGTVLNALTGAFASTFSAPSACALAKAAGIVPPFDQSHHGSITPGTCDWSATSS
jgi:hypothetical protein